MDSVVADTTGTTAAGGPATAPDAALRLADEAAARRLFSTAIVVSGIRCLVTYVLLPFVAPLVGLAASVGPGVGVAVGTVAIAANVLTIRRFHNGRHRWRWGITAIAVSVICLLVVLLVRDVSALI